MDIYLLHIDTATQVCSVALSVNGEVLRHKTLIESNMHTKMINLLIESLFAKESIKIDLLSGISVAVGPGSYTGLRVGMSAAKGIAYALDIPIVELSTLECLAYPYRDNHEKKSILAAIDARRDEVYMALYNSELQIIKEDHSYIIERNKYPAYWLANQKLIVCGNGAEKIGRILENPNLDIDITNCDASNQVQLAYDKFKKGKLADIAYIKPNYIKPPNITQAKKKLF